MVKSNVNQGPGPGPGPVNLPVCPILLHANTMKSQIVAVNPADRFKESQCIGDKCICFMGMQSAGADGSPGQVTGNCSLVIVPMMLGQIHGVCNELTDIIDNLVPDSENDGEEITPENTPG